MNPGSLFLKSGLWVWQNSPENRSDDAATEKLFDFDSAAFFLQMCDLKNDVGAQALAKEICDREAIQADVREIARIKDFLIKMSDAVTGPLKRGETYADRWPKIEAQFKKKNTEIEGDEGKLKDLQNLIREARSAQKCDVKYTPSNGTLTAHFYKDSKKTPADTYQVIFNEFAASDDLREKFLRFIETDPQWRKLRNEASKRLSATVPEPTDDEASADSEAGALSDEKTAKYGISNLPTDLVLVTLPPDLSDELEEPLRQYTIVCKKVKDEMKKGMPVKSIEEKKEMGDWILEILQNYGPNLSPAEFSDLFRLINRIDAGLAE